MKQRKLKRDKVISIVRGKNLVGVYFADTNGSEVLLECSPQKADKIISAWNMRESDVGAMGDKKLIMVEYMNDNGEWVWYAVYDNATPQEAIKEYCKEHSLKSGKIKDENNTFYCDEDVRAYEVEVWHLEKENKKKSFYQVNVVDGTSATYPDIYHSHKCGSLAEAKRLIKKLEKDLAPTEDIRLVKYNSKSVGKEVDWE